VGDGDPREQTRSRHPTENASMLIGRHSNEEVIAIEGSRTRVMGACR
jgi:hypothetical protein